MPFTVTQARQFLRDYDKLNGSTRQQRNYDKIINDTCREVFSLGSYDYNMRVIRVSVPVAYETGTVSVSANGTTVTGSGTTFTSAMVGRYIRFNEEAEQYLITGFGSTTSLTIENYLGTDNLSNVAYQITQDRISFPTNFRSVHKIVSTNATGGRSALYPTSPTSFENLQMFRQTYQIAEYPYYFATKWDTPTSGNIPTGYIYTYPTPAVPQILTIYYNVWPPNLSADSDQFPVPYEMEGVVREFLLAYLYRENKDPNWTTQMQRAQAVAMQALGATRSNSAHRQRVEWVPPGECLGEVRWPVIDPSVVSQLDP